MTHPDVIVNGGGVIGLMTGWTLARRGVRALVVDSGAPAATDAAAGMLAPSFERTLHGGGAALAAFSAKSLARWKEIEGALAERSGLSIDFDANGVLCVAFDEIEAAVFEADSAGGERLDREAALALEPALSSAVRGGWFARDDGQVDPRRVRAALERALVNDGGALMRGRRVVAVQSAGGAITGVALDSGERLATRRVLIATGAHVGGWTGLPEGAVFPVKGEAVAIERIAGAPSRVVRTARAYLCPKADGRIVIGASEVKGDWSLNTDPRRVGALLAAALAAIPALEDASEISRWAGLRPATADGAPVIGAAEDLEGLAYALGHYRNGVLLAPATADAVAALLCERRPDPSIAAFSAARFNRLGVS